MSIGSPELMSCIRRFIYWRGCGNSKKFGLCWIIGDYVYDMYELSCWSSFLVQVIPLTSAMLLVDTPVKITIPIQAYDHSNFKMHLLLKTYYTVYMGTYRRIALSEILNVRWLNCWNAHLGYIASFTNAMFLADVY